MIDLSAYWREHPPIQTMVQSYLGIRTSPPEAPPVEVPAGAIPDIPFKP